ncbi:MAG: hypothetical protein GY799_12505 [Desulfobulbaceae bacterium]|nr:hypothetical protein [Desulfobulbaceae bacterium]
MTCNSCGVISGLILFQMIADLGLGVGLCLADVLDGQMMVVAISVGLIHLGGLRPEMMMSGC